jgi:hypothetical protein
MFTMSAQVLGDQRTVSAEQDALGITVTASRGLQHARNLNDALRLARDDLGEFLRRGERAGVPWGLCVNVAGISAYYGDVRFCRSANSGGAGLPSTETRRPDPPPLARQPRADCGPRERAGHRPRVPRRPVRASRGVARLRGPMKRQTGVAVWGNERKMRENADSANDR